LTRGLVIGKFYPPHRGHKFLIDTATSRVDHLDVLVCARPHENPSASLRVKWLKEIHPRAKVIRIKDPGRDDDSQFWADYTRRLLGAVPDVVFTSELYGESYARFLGSKHVLVDLDRKNFPVHGRLVREQPYTYWDFLEPCVRAFYVLRICVVGAESTGTTTLARQLAEHYDTVWVPEYGRTYTERLKHGGINTFVYHWRTQEFVHIAKQQQKEEDKLAKLANRVLICDTDALATAIWHQRYVGTWSKEVEAIASQRRYDLYLLTDCDIPFHRDGIRDGHQIRPWMTKRFTEELTKRSARWVLIKGSREERLNRAVQEVDCLLHPAAVTV
jgi:HTH-type transcriptional regulator, transcriptional repressor of NAD biosynthesis genes